MGQEQTRPQNIIGEQNVAVRFSRAHGRYGRYGRRSFRLRTLYDEYQKQNAVSLLDMGLTCRTVAKMIGTRCNSASVVRWRQQSRRREADRRHLRQMAQQQRERGQHF